MLKVPVCYTEPPEKLSLETSKKKKYLAGDWMKHLSLKLLSKPVERRVNTSFPSRKAFSAVLCSFNQENSTVLLLPLITYVFGSVGLFVCLFVCPQDN